MGGQHANLKPGIGARQVVKIMQEATAADNGSFRQIYVKGWEVYDRKNIPWWFYSVPWGFAITMYPEFSKPEMREGGQLY